MEMNYDARLFKAAATAVALAASKEPSLPVFTGILLKNYANGALEIVATDRYRLANAFIYPQHVTEGDEVVDTRLVDAATLMQFVRTVKVGRRYQTHVGVDWGQKPLVMSWGAWACTMKPLGDDDQYPNYRKILDMEYEPSDSGKQSFDPRYLADAARGCSLMAEGHSRTTDVQLNASSKPAFFRPDTALDNTSYVHLLMPVRLNK